MTTLRASVVRCQLHCVYLGKLGALFSDNPGLGLLCSVHRVVYREATVPWLSCSLLSDLVDMIVHITHV